MPEQCAAALNIAGEHFQCDNERPHDGWAHSNRAAQAIWISDRDPVPGSEHKDALTAS